MTSLVIAEHDNQSLKAATLNAVTAAVACGGDVHVLVAGHQAGTAVEAAKQVAGVAKVIHVDAPHLENQLGENLAEQVLALASNYSHILAPATAVGKNTLPRVAAKLDVAQVSEITKVISADTFERPIYAGNAVATVQATDATKVITVGPAKIFFIIPATPSLIYADIIDLAACNAAAPNFFMSVSPCIAIFENASVAEITVSTTVALKFSIANWASVNGLAIFGGLDFNFSYVAAISAEAFFINNTDFSPKPNCSCILGAKSLTTDLFNSSLAFANSPNVL